MKSLHGEDSKYWGRLANKGNHVHMCGHIPPHDGFAPIMNKCSNLETNDDRTFPGLLNGWVCR